MAQAVVQMRAQPLSSSAPQPPSSEEELAEQSGIRLRYVGIVAFIVVFGFADGAFRAYTGTDSILGERMGLEDQGAQPSMLAGVAAEGFRSRGAEDFGSFEGLRSLEADGQMLMQRTLGRSCRHNYNCVSSLVCRGGQCTSCEANYECQERNSQRQCFNSTSDAHPVCRHKSLFFPFDIQDFWLSIVTFFTIALAAPTGTGGGGILVPMYMIIGQFSAHAAIPLSKATILGGAIANNYINVQRRHPYANRPLIEYSTLKMMVPPLLVGTIFGVFLNAVSPAWLVTFGLVISLGYSAHAAGNKAWKLYIEESRAPAAGEEQPLLEQKKQPVQHYSFEVDDEANPELAEILKAESKHDFKTLGVIVASWAIVALCSSLKSGVWSTFSVACGSSGFWITSLTPVPIILIITWAVGKELHTAHTRKLQLGYRFSEEDPQWTSANTRFYPAVAVGMGMLAGALGIAAGTLVGPLLLELGSHPMVSVATTGFMVLFTASSTTMQYMLLGRLKLDYAAFYTVIGLFAGSLGNTTVNYFVRKHKKLWFVVFVLFATIALSTVLLGYTGLYRALRAWFEGEDMWFKDLCHDSEAVLRSSPGGHGVVPPTLNAGPDNHNPFKI